MIIPDRIKTFFVLHLVIFIPFFPIILIGILVDKFVMGYWLFILIGIIATVIDLIVHKQKWEMKL